MQPKHLMVMSIIKNIMQNIHFVKFRIFSSYLREQEFQLVHFGTGTENTT